MGGAGRLTDACIDRMQNNYGEAIRNHNEVNSMKTVYNHMTYLWSSSISTAPKTSTPGADIGRTKCKIKVDTQRTIVFLFDRLSDEDLLKRCMLSSAQNQNDSINNVLWSLCSKRTFCGFRKLPLCVAETVSKFNCCVGTKAVVGS